ncbi:MAG: GHKL domain-containing protein [Lachnospiraceae bacterium]|nr:GHKL domain-containing protein [Lachnospiraceae bacterium]
MAAILINLAGIVYAFWRAAVLWYVWRRYIPSEEKTDRIVFVISVVTGIIFHFFTFPIRGGFLLVHGVLLIAFCAWKKRPYLQEASFVILMVYAFQTLFVLFMSGLGEIIAPLFFRSTLEGVADMSVVEREAAVYQAVFHLIGGIMLTAETFGACRIISHPPKQTWTDTAYLSVLNVIGIIFSFVITDLAVVPLEKEVFVLTTEKRALIWVLPLVACLIYAGELAVLYSWKRYRETLVREQRLFVEAKEKEAFARRLNEVEQFQDGIRRVRHDMKNHMTNIKGLAACGNYAELEDYITRLDETISAPVFLAQTGHPVTDIILSDKQSLMQENDIRFTSQFVIEGEPFIPVYDLGIVLNNLLDNAIEACGKIASGERFISLSGKYKGNFMLITVENSFDGQVSQNADGSYRSTKSGDTASEHGFGLKNVQEIAERYLGGVTIDHSDQTFRVTVMLQRYEG